MLAIASGRSVMLRAAEMLKPFDATSVDHLTQLLYELLDAHEDTTRLAEDYAGDPVWEAHLDYLRRLQRLGRETLANLAQ